MLLLYGDVEISVPGKLSFTRLNVSLSNGPRIKLIFVGTSYTVSMCVSLVISRILVSVRMGRMVFIRWAMECPLRVFIKPQKYKAEFPGKSFLI